MAGAYTHLLLCDIAKTKRGVLGKGLWQLLNRHYRFLFLGSVSPDLPYLSFKTGSVNWADVMHYEKTNSTFETAYTALKASWKAKTEVDEAKLVWLLGYVSHMVADATIHPVVQATVGIYEDHKVEHRDCEMTQDSIIFNARKDGADIRYAEFADMVHFCKASPHFDKLMGFWKESIMINYGDKHEEVQPGLWFTTYSRAIDVADANSVFTALFRHVGIGSYLYKTAEDIKTNHSNEYMKYFQAVTLPDKTTTNFNNVFTRTLNNVTDVWKAIYDGLNPGSPPITIVKAWNFDTGVDTNSPNKEVTYWEYSADVPGDTRDEYTDEQMSEAVGQGLSKDRSGETQQLNTPKHTINVALDSGPSTHIATDIWTLDDALGYHAYAHAIFRFMTHPQTKPPLTISIQAPWGGGKTSLMRMIQKQLDPNATERLKEGVKELDGGFTTKEAFEEIDEWVRLGTKKSLPLTPEDKTRKLLTVWFNAWKYESTNQVWAGLVDAIMKQVAARLSRVEKERFWLRLNFGRVDVEKIRHRFYERIINHLWRTVHRFILFSGGLLLVSMTTLVIGWLAHISTVSNLSWIGIVLSPVISIISIFKKYGAARQSTEGEPATVSLREYLDIPDYNKELGFVHHVEADLQRVFASIPQHDRPLVIFIDDLDRCSPAKVAQVFEAVNLFLAGDFPHCFFVLGMDSEMVAAALQSAHKDVLACLPADASIPVGWRFMDKFVQLPFLIPPPEDIETMRYARSLFTTDEELILDPAIEQIALESAKNVPTKSAVANETVKLQAQHNLTEKQRHRLQERIEIQVVQRVLDEGIQTFTDKNPVIQRVIETASSYFSGTPRELKRFLNVFRFYYFTLWARKAKELESPTLDQLLRWIILIMKWPEVARWLRRNGGTEWCVEPADGDPEHCFATLKSRMKLIESISGKATDVTSWQEQAQQILRLSPKDAPWLNEAQLLHFFYEEHTQYPEGQRLSDGEGKGLW